MDDPRAPEPDEPRMSMSLRSFAAEDPGGWESMLGLAEEMDAAGVDRIAVSDHVCFGEALDAYADPSIGGRAGGRQPTDADGHWLEPLTVLTAVAARTARIRLSTSILLAALRRPVVLAKTASTIDVLSGGRLDLGVGVGRMREAVAAVGRDPAGIGVQGRVPVVRDDRGSVDLVRTMAGVPPLVDAGVTDVRVDVGVPDGADPGEHLAEVVARFRSVVGRDC